MGVAIYLFSFLCAAGYILFGVMHMIAPGGALAVYRFVGRKKFEAMQVQWMGMSRRAWKLLGAGYICFGMLIAWLTMRSLESHSLAAR